MSTKEFWNLSLYEWSLWLYRIAKLRNDRNQDRELSIELVRNFMALFANANRDPKKTPAFSGKDFYKLSYDEISQDIKKLSAVELMPLLIEKYKNKPIRKRHG